MGIGLEKAADPILASGSPRTIEFIFLIHFNIIMAIIAVLLTILAPVLNVAREMAKGSVCLGNQKIPGKY